ncbi:MAG: serine/threonine-protein kinase, partial [Pseudomonadota bacterium]
MAKVYKSEQRHLNRTVAVKVLDPKHVGADDPEFQKRFELEAQMTSQLNHPNTVTIHDYGFNAENHFYFFVMEFIKGKTLRRAMKEEGIFEIDRALHIGRQIARSVRQANSVGVIHRDLKPSNVLLTSHDRDTNYVKVVDFGLLKLKKESAFDGEKTEGTLMGSPRYMSPEQIKRLPVDHRSDIYSLGVNLYQMLTGRPPFAGSSAVQILMGHLNQAPPAFSACNPRNAVPDRIEEFVMKCLSKDPNGRPQDMDEVIETIAELKKNIGEKPGAYSSVPTSGQVDVVGTDRTAEQEGDDRSSMEEAPSQPSAPPAWSDTL